MSKANDIIGAFFKGLVGLYELILVRLLVTGLAVIVTFIYWTLTNPQPNALDHANFERLWLSCAYAVSGIVTGVLFVNLFFNNQSDKVKNVGALGIIIILIFAFLTFVPFKNAISNWVPLGVALMVYGYDWLLADAGVAGLKDDKWQSFDLAVIVGVFIVIVLQLTLPGLSDEARCMFGGGGTSFQLIMANMVFDPKTYR